MQLAVPEASMIGSFRDLEVWQKGMVLVEMIYAFSERWPRSEMPGLTSQIRRAAVSIPANIAEGKAIGGQSFRRHVQIALGCEAELQTHIALAQSLRMIDKADAERLTRETTIVGKMLVNLLNSLPRAPKPD